MAIDGKPIPNLVGLCRGHHSDVENNRAKIEYAVDRFYWRDKGGFPAPLRPVPLIEAGPSSSSPTSETTLTATAVGASLDEREEEEGSQLRDGRESTSRSPVSEEGPPAATGPDASYELSDAPPPSSGDMLLPKKPGAGVAVTPLAPGSPCPGCGRKLPKPKAEQEPARVKVTFSIKVPKDAREDGYELLRSLLTQCQEELGREGEPGYFTLVEVMYGWLTSAKEKAVA